MNLVAFSDHIDSMRRGYSTYWLGTAVNDFVWGDPGHDNDRRGI